MGNAFWEEERMKTFCENLAGKLIEKGYNITHGDAPIVGKSTSTGVWKKLINEKHKSIKTIKKRFSPYPLPEHGEIKKTVDWIDCRKELLSNVGIAIFIAGEDDSYENQGTLEEYEIAREKNVITILIGFTGYRAGMLHSKIESEDIEEVAEYFDCEHFENDEKKELQCLYYDIRFDSSKYWNKVRDDKIIDKVLKIVELLEKN